MKVGFDKRKPVICGLCHKKLTNAHLIFNSEDEALKYHVAVAHGREFWEACEKLVHVCKLAQEISQANISGMTALKELSRKAVENFEKVSKNL